MSPKFSSQVLLLCIKWVSQFRECASYRGQQRQLRDTTQDGAVLAFILRESLVWEVESGSSRAKSRQTEGGSLFWVAMEKTWDFWAVGEEEKALKI